MISEVGARTLTGAGAPSGGTTTLNDSTPYPWPYDGAFDAGRCALIVLDTADPPASELDPARLIVRNLAGAVATAGGLIIEVHGSRPPRGTTTAPAVATRRRLAEADHVLAGPGWDGFYGTSLDQILRANGRDLLLFAGAWLEVGVHSTMRGANDRGFECALVADASIAGTPFTRAAALSSIEMSGGIFGVVAHSTDVHSLLATSSDDKDLT